MPEHLLRQTYVHITWFTEHSRPLLSWPKTAISSNDFYLHSKDLPVEFRRELALGDFKDKVQGPSVNHLRDESLLFARHRSVSFLLYLYEIPSVSRRAIIVSECVFAARDVAMFSSLSLPAITYLYIGIVCAARRAPPLPSPVLRCWCSSGAARLVYVFERARHARAANHVIARNGKVPLTTFDLIGLSNAPRRAMAGVRCECTIDFSRINSAYDKIIACSEIFVVLFSGLIRLINVCFMTCIKHFLRKWFYS